ncbi:hypothetical protein QC763_112507 [Podospora pseudopauciseta]|uniref:Uncharacterized protein n=1 Tax=Podospora pseudopauciseta TaxID=2093780 RepID=A0ABR0I032_9PEZI|nr:hypothetical protein QC763_112507 [Podospora pseudopauciseta]
MTGPQRDFQPGRTSFHPVPVPSNNWPTSFSPKEIRQVQTIYSITFGATYTGNIGSFLPPPRSPATYYRIDSLLRLSSTGYGHRSSDNNEKHAHRATNWFVDQKWHLDIKERDARQAERRKEHEQRMEEMGGQWQGPPY